MSKKLQIYYDTEGLPYQAEFHNSRKPKAYLSTGFGGGKTYSLIMKMFLLMDENMGMRGGVLCPTLKMYRRDVAPTIREICYDNDIDFKENKSDMVWQFPDAEAEIYIFHSEDDGVSIRGPNLAWGVINEVTLCSELAYKAFISRIRLKSAKLLQVACSGTPESFNWCYDYFIVNPREDCDLIFGDATMNHHVADSYFDMLRESYDEKMQQQYIEGKFINLTGNRCLYAFDRFKHTDPNITKLDGYPVLVSCDFNVSPMAATLWNRVSPQEQLPDRTVKRQATLRAFDQIKIDSADTYDLCKAIREKTSSSDKIIIYPDPAGGSRSTKVKDLTDIKIIRQCGFDDIRYRSRIGVRKCLNASNALFSKNLVAINPITCPDMVADAEQVIFRKGVFEMDKSNMKRTHWLDGMKNMIEYEFPISGGRGFTEQRMR